MEEQLGLRLPADYNAFLQTYGAGEINGLIDVASPTFGQRTVRLTGFIDHSLSIARAQRDSGMSSPYPIFPEKGGLLPWGSTGNGDQFFWRTDPPDEPDRWSVVAHDRGSGAWIEYPGQMTAFLADALEQRTQAPGRLYFEDHPPEFVPFDPIYDGVDPGSGPWGWPRPHIDPIGYSLYPDRDWGMTGVQVYLGHQKHPSRIRAVFAAAGIAAPEELVELYSWHDGMNQALWTRLQRMHQASGRPLGSGPIEFLPGILFPSLHESIADHSRLESDDPGWRSEWFPVFVTARGRFAVECSGDGVVLFVPQGDSRAAEIRFSRLSELLTVAAGRFADGSWDWLDEEWRFRAKAGSEL